MLNLVPFLSFVFVTTFTPGPNNIMSMTNANNHGFKKTLNFMLGIFTGFALIMVLCSYFNLFLVNIIPKIKFYMSLLGAIYMTYLAIKIMRSDNGKNDKSSDYLNTFSNGLTMQFVNPKVILYSITVISNFIIPYYKSNISLLFFSVLLASVAFISICSWAIFGALFQRFLDKYKKPFNIVMGILLIYSAISISGLIK